MIQSARDPVSSRVLSQRECECGGEVVWCEGEREGEDRMEDGWVGSHVPQPKQPGCQTDDCT